MKKQIKIFGVPKFSVPLTLKEAVQLQAMCVTHYDYVCRTAGEPGGFIHGWVNQLSYAPASIKEEQNGPEINATWRELDTMLKICEQIHMAPEILELARHIRAAMQYAAKIATTWEDTYP